MVELAVKLHKRSNRHTMWTCVPTAWSIHALRLHVNSLQNFQTMYMQLISIRQLYYITPPPHRSQRIRHT